MRKNPAPDRVDYGNHLVEPKAKDGENTSEPVTDELSFPNGKETMEFTEFYDMIKESCEDKETAEGYLIHAFSMFDRKSKFYVSYNPEKGYISKDDLKEVFSLLGENV